ncbi:hypothetical protein KIN20_028012 [Parelaphostrongylus tenuis]|uniref:Uncharacterized protein n=1 Tax=Parelaphostrongylus tenuis TaxID=148309 RepID=A0AAD5R0A8_PARTN|nr:hypothetical protein KIN20_028012 [Parelaphostrongylus tenuis]
MVKSRAVVAHSGSETKVATKSSKNRDRIGRKGKTLPQSVKNRAVIKQQLCPRVASAETVCNGQNNDIKLARTNCGTTRVVFDANGDVLSEYSAEHSDTYSSAEQLDEAATEPYPIDEAEMGVLRELLENLIRETDLDITRLKNRKDMLQQLHIQYFGTRPDGSITGGEEGHLFSLAHKLGSKFLHRINNQTVQSDDLFSHFDSLVEDRKRRRTDQEKERIKSKRPRYNDENDDCAEPTSHWPIQPHQTIPKSFDLLIHV